MKRRPNSYKINDVKNVRRFTNLLGKLGIPSLVRVHHHPASQSKTGVAFDQYVYGWGLKESVDYVMQKYEYYMPHEETAADQLRNTNIIHETKRTRQFMSMLNRLGITSADAGLSVCKRFVLRQRN